MDLPGWYDECASPLLRGSHWRRDRQESSDDRCEIKGFLIPLAGPHTCFRHVTGVTEKKFEHGGFDPDFLILNDQG